MASSSPPLSSILRLQVEGSRPEAARNDVPFPSIEFFIPITATGALILIREGLSGAMLLVSSLGVSNSKATGGEDLAERRRHWASCETRE